MEIIVNNSKTSTHAADLQALAVELGLPEKGVALALDSKMVPRSEWGNTPLHEGAKLLVIRPTCGG